MFHSSPSLQRAVAISLALACTLFNSTVSVAQTATTQSPALFETGGAIQTTVLPIAPTVLKVVSYNIRWRGGDELQELISLLRDDREIGRATIIGLQEVDRNKKRTGNVNTVRRMAEALGMNYAWAAPPVPPQTKSGKPQEEETGVAILSPYPLSDARPLVLPNEGPKGRRRVALGVTVQLRGGAAAAPIAVRVYSVHGETRITVARKVEALQAVLDDLKRYDETMPAIVLGDFNTIEPEAVRDVTYLFSKAGFQTPFTNNEETWKTFILKLKLDWLWLRHFKTVEHGIDRKVGLSDHWPLWANVTLQNEPQTSR